MPQTLEHLAIASLLHVRRGVVALTKSDRVDEEWLDLARETTRDLLDEDPDRASWEIVAVSAVTGEGMEALRDALRRAMDGLGMRSDDDRFRLPVDRSFSIRGTGTVVTGTVWSGSLAVGDTVRVFPGGTRPVSARSRCTRIPAAASRPAAGAPSRSSAWLRPRWSVAAYSWACRSGSRAGVSACGSGHSEVVTALCTTGSGSGSTSERGKSWPACKRRIANRLRPGLPRGASLPLRRRCSHAPATGPSSASTRRSRRSAGFAWPNRIRPRDWAPRTDAWEAVLDGAPADALSATVGLEGLRGLPVPAASIRLGRRDATLAAAAEEAGCVRVGERWVCARRHGTGDGGGRGACGAVACRGPPRARRLEGGRALRSGSAL